MLVLDAGGGASGALATEEPSVEVVAGVELAAGELGAGVGGAGTGALGTGKLAKEALTVVVVNAPRTDA